MLHEQWAPGLRDNNMCKKRVIWKTWSLWGNTTTWWKRKDVLGKEVRKNDLGSDLSSLGCICNCEYVLYSTNKVELLQVIKQESDLQFCISGEWHCSQGRRWDRGAWTKCRKTIYRLRLHSGRGELLYDRNSGERGWKVPSSNNLTILIHSCILQTPSSSKCTINICRRNAQMWEVLPPRTLCAVNWWLCKFSNCVWTLTS